MNFMICRFDFIFVRYTIRRCRPNADDGFHDDGQTNFANELTQLFERFDLDATSHGQTSRLCHAFHSNLATIDIGLRRLLTCDIKIFAQLRFNAKPKFILRIDAIDLAIFRRQITYRAKHRIVLRHIGNIDVFIEHTAQFIANRSTIAYTYGYIAVALHSARIIDLIWGIVR